MLVDGQDECTGGGITHRSGTKPGSNTSSGDRERRPSLVAIRQAGYHVGWVKFWQLRTGELLSMVSARNAKTGEKFVVHARSDHEATVELARWLGVGVDGDEA